MSEPQLKVASADAGWSTGTVTFSFMNAEVAGEDADAPAPEALYVNLQFPLADATKASARARAKEVLQSAIAALD